MRAIIALSIVAGIGVGIYVVLQRLSSETLALLTGLLYGLVVLAIFGLFGLVIMRMAGGRRPEPPAQQPVNHYPPVIVVGGMPPYGLPQPGRQPEYEPPLFGPQDRKWTVIGGSDDDDLWVQRPPARKPEPVTARPEPVVSPARTNGPAEGHYRAVTFTETHGDLGEPVEEPAEEIEPDAESGPLVFRSDEEVVSDFVTDWCRHDGGWTGATELYQAYCTFCDSDDWQPVTQTRFGLLLAGLGVQKRRAPSGGYMYSLVPAV